MTECPCKECLLKPVCRNKLYDRLMLQCELLRDYCFYTMDYKTLNKSMLALHRKRVIEIYFSLEPNTWTISKERKHLSTGLSIASSLLKDELDKWEYPPFTELKELRYKNGPV